MKNSAELQQKLAEHLLKKPTAPRIYRTLIRDITPESLLDRAAKNYPLFGLAADEGGQVLSGHATRSLPLLNSARDGSAQYVDRKSSASQVIKFLRLSSHIEAQPKTVFAFLEGKGHLARDNGFLARNFVSYPYSTQGYRFISSTESMTWPVAEVFGARIREMLQKTKDLHARPVDRLPVLKLDDEAAFSWVNYANMVEGSQQPGFCYSKVKDAASKAAENAARLASVLHAYVGREGDIQLDTIQSAQTIVLWYLEQFIRIFAPPIIPQVLIDAQSLDSWLRMQFSTSGHYIHRRNRILQFGPLRKSHELAGALDVLVQHGKVRMLRDAKKTWHVELWCNSPPYVVVTQGR